jgi:N-acetylglucosaminylphosphatidylinositol deacetylase
VDREDGTLALVANTWSRYLATRHAFAQHPSQYTWDRHLYMIMSRYVWFNDLKRVGEEPRQE